MKAELRNLDAAEIKAGVEYIEGVIEGLQSKKRDFKAEQKKRGIK